MKIHIEIKSFWSLQVYKNETSDKLIQRVEAIYVDRGEAEKREKSVNF